MAATDSTEVLSLVLADAHAFRDPSLRPRRRRCGPPGAAATSLQRRQRAAPASTFNDGRQASVFEVNPFGIQADGAINEVGDAVMRGFNCGPQSARGTDCRRTSSGSRRGGSRPQGLRSRAADSVQEHPLPAGGRRRPGASTSCASCSAPGRTDLDDDQARRLVSSWRSPARLEGLSELKRRPRARHHPDSHRAGSTAHRVR